MSPKPATRAKASVKAPPNQDHSLKIYQRLALSFVLLVGATLAVVLYVSTVEARITVTPVTEAIKAELLLDVVKTPTRENEIRGRLLALSRSRTAAYKPSGEGRKEVVGTSRGVVTLTNKTSSSQTLVKTTRLLTSDGKLYRIDAQVTVPAGSSVDAPAYADQPGGTFDIKEGTFTIPGLPASLQSSIYASVKTPFTGGHKVVSVLSKEDVDRAVADLTASLEEEAKAALREQAGGVFTGESFATVAGAAKASAEPGAEVDGFDVTLEVKVTGVFYDRQGASGLVTRALFAQLTPGREFRSVDASALQTTVEKVDVAGESASVKAYLDAVSVPSTTSSALAPSRFTGKGAEEIRRMLVDDGIATDVAVEFFPPFIRKAPRLPDHIIVEVE